LLETLQQSRRFEIDDAGGERPFLGGLVLEMRVLQQSLAQLLWEKSPLHANAAELPFLALVLGLNAYDGLQTESKRR
jgi:hypothetical protein